MGKPDWLNSNDQRCNATFDGKPKYLGLQPGKSEYHRRDGKSTRGQGTQKERHHERSSGRRIKVMNGVPTAIYYVHHARKAGWPTRRESQGHGIPIGVSGWESQLQGEVG